jgi:hypothetical protein
MASAKGQVGKAIINKLAKKTVKSRTGAAISATSRAARNVKAVGGIAKLEAKDALIKAGSSKAGKKAKAGVGVLAGKNVKRAKEMALNAKTLKGQSRAVKAVTGQKRKTAVARAGVAAGAAAIGGAAYAKSKSGSKSVGSKVKSAASTAKRKTQAGYKMVYGKLKRVRAGR